MTQNSPHGGPGAQGAILRRSPSIATSLSLTDRMFSSGEDRKMIRAIDDGVELLAKRLIAESQFNDGLADVAARYLLEAGGKRVRPILTMLTAQLGEGVNDEVITAGTSIELTHMASLYHDDVMDEAPERRGVPTAQHVWGNSVAILVGDLLFARASKLLSTLGERAIRLQSDTFERLCLGQLHETIGPKPGEDPIVHYLRVLSDKTGSLIAAAAQFGVIFSNAPAEYEAPVVEFGEKVGIAFQLIDDVIDLAPPGDATGKKAGTDIRAGVATLPLLKLRRLAETDLAANALLVRIESSSTTEAELDLAIAELRAHAVTTETIAQAHRYAAEATAALASLPNGSVKKSLVRFADTVVERTA